MTVKIKIDNETVIRVITITLLFILAVNFIQAVQAALILVGTAIFLALALNPPVSYISSKITKGSRAGATGIAYLAVVIVIVGFLWALVPPLISETGKFLNNVPSYVDQVKTGDNFVAGIVERYDLDEDIESFGADLASSLRESDGALLSGLTRVGTAIVSILTVLVLTFFMLVEGPFWLDKFWDTQSAEKREHRQMLARKMYHVVTGYVNGQLLIALLAAFASLLVMFAFGIPFALPLAGVVGIFGLIPLVGATLGSVLVILVALFQSVQAGIGMAIFFLVYQQFENNFIQPYVQSRTLDVSPLLILVSVIFGISVGGIFGGFIAIPVAAIIRILMLDSNEQRKLKEKKRKKK